MRAMATEEFVDVTYRGIEVGNQLKLIEFGPTTAYLEHPKPLPVGTQLDLVAAGLQFSVRVLRVNEQVAGAEVEAGMRVGVALEGEVKGWWEEKVSCEDPQIPEPVPPPLDGAVAEVPAQAEVLAEAAAPVEAEAVPTEEEPARPTLEMAAVEAGDSEEPTTEIEMVADEPEPDAEPAPEVEAAPASTDEVPTASHRKRGPARTQIMSAVDIQLAIGAGGQEVVDGEDPEAEVEAAAAALADDGNGDGDGDGNGNGDGNGDGNGNGDEAGDDKPKKKRRRRRRKRK